MNDQTGRGPATEGPPPPAVPDILEALGQAMNRAFDGAATRTANNPRNQRLLARLRASLPPGNLTGEPTLAKPATNHR
ncbi:hypothetical protein ACIA8O_38660 [Kitasatospora sp. NPDC051853]|uniref:hypothetical protein n=1 Tax=Kitasatospora sp. NPDC051853 TaxID=3364058 RepID=UPI0037A8A060